MSLNKVVIISLAILLAFLGKYSAKLTENHYSSICPQFEDVVRDVVKIEFKKERSRRTLASILCLHFHDCFVNGCDGSILLNDTTHLKGEIGAGPNRNSVRGFEVIESIKTNLAKFGKCKTVVSCADILTLAARHLLSNLEGLIKWVLAFGRRDGYVKEGISKADANKYLPNPDMNINDLKKKLSALHFNTTELVGAHTVGQARCVNFRARIYSKASPINSTFAAKRQKTCPNEFGDDDNLAPLDIQTSLQFDNSYYKDLVAQECLLHIDQEFYNRDRETAGIVNKYSKDQRAFFTDFSNAMTKMSLLNLQPENQGEIRKFCSRVS